MCDVAEGGIFVAYTEQVEGFPHGERLIPEKLLEGYVLLKIESGGAVGENVDAKQGQHLLFEFRVPGDDKVL
jgi:hypothetical protein